MSYTRIFPNESIFTLVESIVCLHLQEHTFGMQSFFFPQTHLKAQAPIRAKIINPLVVTVLIVDY